MHKRFREYIKIKKERYLKYMKYGIAIDSGCDLRNLDLWGAETCAFGLAPLKLVIGNKDFVDNSSLNIEQFMEEVEAYKGKSGSAAPSPGEWMDAFEQADGIFAFTITAALSGSYNSAETAKHMILEKHPEKKIFIMNTLSIGPETSLLVRKTMEYIKKGMEFDAICEAITAYAKTTKLLFVLEHMDNLIKNGRVGRIQGSLAGLLGIKILGRASEEGKLDLLHKKRGKNAVYNTCVEEMIARGFRGGRVIIGTCLEIEQAEYLKKQLLQKYPQSDIMIMPSAGICTYYAERGGLLIGFETEEA